MAQAVFVHEGCSIDFTPAADVAAGDVVVQGDLVGVAKLDIKANKLGALAVEGVFDFPVEEIPGWSVGQLAYWNASDQWADTGDSGGVNKLLGKVVLVDSRPGSPHVRVRLSQ
jgi:predicted RecA/RadA family phage recombinase